MGALAHYLERENIPTTQISLIREHTETIKPPRALWVPFDLGRPLGPPEEPALQRRVLVEALELFNIEEGPVLKDFSEDVAGKTGDSRESLDHLACPVSFRHSSPEESGGEALLADFRQEVAEFRPWYDLNLDKQGYTTMAFFTPDTASGLLRDFVTGENLQFPEGISSPGAALRLAAQDLKTFYFEAVKSRPDKNLPGDLEFDRWFWQKTAAGRVLKLVREICQKSDDEEIRTTGTMFLVPLDQA